MNRPLLAILLALPLCCFSQAAAGLAGENVVPFVASCGCIGDCTVKFHAILVVALLVAGVMFLIWCWIGIRKRKDLLRELEERSQTIEKQRRQESELRKELEEKQKELDAALQTVQSAYNEKTAILTDLEDASELARLASFH